MTYFDVRRVLQQDRDVERYLGIQRPLNNRRVTALQQYVNFYDASFSNGNHRCRGRGIRNIRRGK